MNHRRKIIAGLSLATACFSFSSAAPALADGSDWDTAGFIENATFVRSDRGFSKIRTTGQYEFSKDFGKKFGLSGFRVTGTLRGTYDAVYDLNDDEFGDNAGGARSFQSINVVPGEGTPWGASPIGTGLLNFGFDTVANPNEGLAVLGEEFHDPNGGVTLGVPVRPCDVDSRGCGLEAYSEFDGDDLRFPEFNDELDFIRELYVEGSIPTSETSEWFMRIGKQQIVWGRTDLFRVLDIINPVDFGRQNIYDELEDIRIPQWIASAEYRAGAVGAFDDLNLQFVWNFDKFRPNMLGAPGSPYAILDASNFFRAMNNCWENGCTVSNFAPPPGAMPGQLVAADFPANVIGIRQVNLPEHKLENWQGGVKLEGVFKSVGFSLNYYHFYQQLPTLQGGIPALNPFGPAVGDLTASPRDYLIAFDIGFPEVDLFGGSLDFYVDALTSVFRVEAAYTQGEQVANSLDPQLYSESDMFRWVVGWDRNTFIPFLNEKRAFLLSAQVFGEHFLDHELEQAPLGPVGIPNWEDNYIFTFLIKGWYKSDTISPQIITAYDTEAKAGVVAPSIDWLINDNWRLIIGANIKFGDGMGDQSFDDCRACNPFPPFTASPVHQADPSGGLTPYSIGLGGTEPLGRFRAGPIGSASEENEIQLTIRYRF